METTQLQGDHYQVSANKINIFGAVGLVEGGRWYVNLTEGDALMGSAVKESMLPGIQKCIDQDIAAGLAHKIAYIFTGARQAVVMFMEGILRADHFQHATEGISDDGHYIDIPNVDILGRPVTVRVFVEPSLRFATADSEGNVIKP